MFKIFLIFWLVCPIFTVSIKTDNLISQTGLESFYRIHEKTRKNEDKALEKLFSGQNVANSKDRTLNHLYYIKHTLLRAITIWRQHLGLFLGENN